MFQKSLEDSDVEPESIEQALASRKTDDRVIGRNPRLFNAKSKAKMENELRKRRNRPMIDMLSQWTRLKQVENRQNFKKRH